MKDTESLLPCFRLSFLFALTAQLTRKCSKSPRITKKNFSNIKKIREKTFAPQMKLRKSWYMKNQNHNWFCCWNEHWSCNSNFSILYSGGQVSNDFRFLQDLSRKLVYSSLWPLQICFWRQVTWWSLCTLSVRISFLLCCIRDGQNIAFFVHFRRPTQNFFSPLRNLKGYVQNKFTEQHTKPKIKRLLMPAERQSEQVSSFLQAGVQP